MSNVAMVLVGFRSRRRSGHDLWVHGEAERLTRSESFGCLVNLRDNQQNAFHNPGLSLDNPGCHPHTGDKE